MDQEFAVSANYNSLTSSHLSTIHLIFFGIPCIYLFQEIYSNVFSLMTDVFGNYVVQKFFEYGTFEQRRLLGDALSGHVVSVRISCILYSI